MFVKFPDCLNFALFRANPLLADFSNRKHYDEKLQESCSWSTGWIAVYNIALLTLGL